jgi:hypothetical protein
MTEQVNLTDRENQILSPKHPAYREAKDTAETATAAAAVPGLKIIDELITYIGTMPVAWRFSRTVPPVQDGKTDTYGATSNPQDAGLDESDYQRESLMKEAETLQEELVTWGSKLHDLVMRVRSVETD